MIETLGTAEAVRMLMDDDNAKWTHAGAETIVHYLEELEEDTGEPIEFDRVAIRCEWDEYSSAVEAAQAYGWEPEADAVDVNGKLRDPDDMKEENNRAAFEWLGERTTVLATNIEPGDGVVLVEF